MISLWVLVTGADVESYAAGLMLPPYLAHLRLSPFDFSAQPENCDGEEPLKLVYVGEGRLEEYLLDPDEHALPLIRSVCPGICDSRLHLPQDDARWSWAAVEGADSQEASYRMRIFFAPAAQSLSCRRSARRSAEANGYVSVSRGHVFVGRPMVEAYVETWLEFLSIEAPSLAYDFDMDDSQIEFSGETIGGQVFFGDDVLAKDLIRFADLDIPLQDAGRQTDIEIAEAGDVSEEGIYIPLSSFGLEE